MMPHSAYSDCNNTLPTSYMFGQQQEKSHTMDYTSIIIILSISWTCIYLLTTTLSRRKFTTTANATTANRLPPGPYPFPIVGNFFQLGLNPHQTLANFSKTYGPLMSLKLGTRTTIVVSSPKIAKEMLQKHDLAFSSRSHLDGGDTFDHHDNSIVWLPVGSQWRKYRKICKEQIFSTTRLDASQGLRKKVVANLLDHANECSLNGEAMFIGRAGHTTTLNLLSNFFFSIDLARHNLGTSQDFKDYIWSLMELGGKPNLVDYFPVLKRIDPQGVREKTKFYYEKLFGTFDRIIDQRLRERSSSGDAPPACDDALDSVLGLINKKDSEFSIHELRHLLLDLFIAGTDTTSSTMEWAMSELLLHPETMAKARVELKEAIGKNGVVEESDISRLPYLQAIIKETLRLHPPAPFLVPHKAESNVEIEGFTIPKNAQIFFNIWATSRDSSVWSEPEEFKPERFIGNEIDFKGQDFELIPFGAGRRICPGLPLAQKMLHLMLGSLLYSFDWKLEGDDMSTKDLDMSEKFGLTLQKAVSLRAIPIKILGD